MVLTRQEKEKIVLELYNRRTPIREIAKQAGMSFRDIGSIVDKAEREKEAKEGRAQQTYMSTQAYKLFLEGKTPVQVAITLNIRENQVTQYYREYCALTQLDALNQIYQEVKGDIWYFVNLYRSAKSAGMDVQHVNRLLSIANNNLPAVEDRNESLNKQINSKQSEKQNLDRLIQDYNRQITGLGKTFDSCCLSCQQEEDKLYELQKKRMKEERLVKYFEDHNEEYIKITKTIESKVHTTLLNTKSLLIAAVLSVIESIRKDPDRFIGSLIDYDNNNASLTTPIAEYYNRGYYYSSSSSSSSYTYEQQQYSSSTNSSQQARMNMLIEEAEKLYNKLTGELIDNIINNYYADIEVEKRQKYMDTNTV